ncbi:hypothetical protein QYF36_015877 [Acer negundo]|nr:hypothetical protein QYF36_015877 [Acer negundo]
MQTSVQLIDHPSSSGQLSTSNHHKITNAGRVLFHSKGVLSNPQGMHSKTPEKQAENRKENKQTIKKESKTNSSKRSNYPGLSAITRLLMQVEYSSIQIARLRATPLALFEDSSKFSSFDIRVSHQILLNDTSLLSTWPHRAWVATGCFLLKAN